MNVEHVLESLRAMASEKYKENVVKLGIPSEQSLGVSTGDVRKLAQSVKRELKKQPEQRQALAWGLWNTGMHEAKLLAALLLDGKTLTVTEAEGLMADVESWDLCDHLCKNLFKEMPGYTCLIGQWRGRRETYFKRAAFALVATAMIHEKEVKAEDVDQYLRWIREAASDDREHVKKAVSWALREIGKRDFDLLEKAAETARGLSESAVKAEKWVGKDALKELEKLTAVEGRQRLIRTDSQMGRVKNEGNE